MNDGSTAFLTGAVWTCRPDLRVIPPAATGPPHPHPARRASIHRRSSVAETRVLGQALREQAHDRERLLQMAARLPGSPCARAVTASLAQADQEAAPLLGMARIDARQPPSDLQPSS